jgi:hypothetical protein
MVFIIQHHCWAACLERKARTGEGWRDFAGAAQRMLQQVQIIGLQSQEISQER